MVSHQVGSCIEHGLGNKARNILTQTCEKQLKNDIRALMNTFAERKRSKCIFPFHLFWWWLWWSGWVHYTTLFRHTFKNCSDRVWKKNITICSVLHGE